MTRNIYLMLFRLLTVTAILFSSNVFCADSNEYTLASGDSIRVLVFQNPELTTDTRVSESGKITFPLVGEISVGGLPIHDAELKIANALKSGGYVQEPQVNIVLVAILGNRFSVLGLVNKPGRYPIDTFDIHLSEALALAGGVIPGAGAGFIELNGYRDGKKTKIQVDIATLMLGENKDKDILVSSGDVIFVTPGNQVSVIGLVNRPGRYTIDNLKMDLVDVIAMAGGMVASLSSDVAVVSGIRNGEPFKSQVNLADLFLNPEDKGSRFFVQSGDQIYVHRAPMYYIYGEAQRPGNYRVERDMTVVQALAQGGGPTPRGTQRNLKIYRKNNNGIVESFIPNLTDFIKADDVIYVQESLF